MSDSFTPRTAYDSPAGVIRLHRHPGFPGDITDRHLETYWAGLREGNELPQRSQIDPCAITNILADTFVVQQTAPGNARFRVAGAHIVQLMNMDVRGMPLSTIIAPGDRERFAGALTTLFARPARLRFLLLSNVRTGQPEVAGRMTLLPLRRGFGGATHAIGSLVTCGPPGRAPYRFTITSCTISPLRLGQDAPPMAPQPPQTGQWPRLHLVKSD